MLQKRLTACLFFVGFLRFVEAPVLAATNCVEPLVALSTLSSYLSPPPAQGTDRSAVTSLLADLILEPEHPFTRAWTASMDDDPAHFDRSVSEIHEASGRSLSRERIIQQFGRIDAWLDQGVPRALEEETQRILDERLVAKHLAAHQPRPAIQPGSGELLIVTHQQQELAVPTAEFLRTNQAFQHTPRLILGAPTFPVRSDRLVLEASRIVHSSDGAVSVPPARRYHLLGGNIGLCLNSTFESIVEVFQSSPSSPFMDIEVIFYQRYLYGDPRLMARLRRSRPLTINQVLNRDDGEEDELSDFVEERTPLAQSVQTEGTQSVRRENFLLDPTSGRRIHVIFE